MLPSASAFPNRCAPNANATQQVRLSMMLACQMDEGSIENTAVAFFSSAFTVSKFQWLRVEWLTSLRGALVELRSHWAHIRSEKQMRMAKVDRLKNKSSFFFFRRWNPKGVKVFQFTTEWIKKIKIAKIKIKIEKQNRKLKLKIKLKLKLKWKWKIKIETQNQNRNWI